MESVSGVGSPPPFEPIHVEKAQLQKICGGPGWGTTQVYPARIVLELSYDELLRKSAPGRPLRARIAPAPLTAEARLGSMRWVLASYAASV